MDTEDMAGSVSILRVNLMVPGPRHVFCVGGQESLRVDSIVEFSADSENESLTQIRWSVFSLISPE